jgi:hypothetical protein
MYGDLGILVGQRFLSLNLAGTCFHMRYGQYWHPPHRVDEELVAAIHAALSGTRLAKLSVKAIPGFKRLLFRNIEAMVREHSRALSRACRILTGSPGSCQWLKIVSLPRQVMVRTILHSLDRGSTSRDEAVGHLYALSLKHASMRR